MLTEVGFPIYHSLPRDLRYVYCLLPYREKWRITQTKFSLDYDITKPKNFHLYCRNFCVNYMKSYITNPARISCNIYGFVSLNINPLHYTLDELRIVLNICTYKIMNLLSRLGHFHNPQYNCVLHCDVSVKGACCNN